MTAYNAEKFKNDLINLINTSNLTLPTAYYVFKDVFNSFQSSYLEASKEEPTTETEEIIYGNQTSTEEKGE